MPKKTVYGKCLMKLFASECAKIAFTTLFEQRFGVVEIENLKTPALCFFNNNPYKENVIVADVQRAEFLQRLREIGIEQLGYAEYPEQGPDEGYTYAMILSVKPTVENATRIMNIWTNVFVYVGWEGETS